MVCARTVLAPHVHDRACFAVMLEGAFDVSFRERFFDCPASSIHTEPPGERHSNQISKLGARVLVVQPDPRREEVVRPLAHMLERVTYRQHAGIAGMAAKLARELAMADDVAPLAIEAMALEMLVGAARARTCTPPISRAHFAGSSGAASRGTYADFDWSGRRTSSTPVSGRSATLRSRRVSPIRATLRARSSVTPA